MYVTGVINSQRGSSLFVAEVVEVVVDVVVVVVVVVVVLVVLAVAVVAIVVVLMSDCGCLFRGQAGVSLLTPKKLPCRSRSYTTTL